MAVHIRSAGLTRDVDRRHTIHDSASNAGLFDREWNLVECGRILYRRKIELLCIAGLGILAASLATALQRPLYKSHASIQIQGLNENFLSLRDIYPDATPGADNPVYIQTQAEILRQDALLERAIHAMHLDDRPEFGNGGASGDPSTTLERVRKNVQIVPVRGTSVIQIVCEAGNPQLAADLANTIARTFIEQSIEARQRYASDTQASLSIERDVLRRSLVASEAALAASERAGKSGMSDSALKRELDTNRQFYEFISQRVNEARVASAVGQSNVRVVSPAQPSTRPYRPNLLLNLLFGSIGGLVLGIGHVMLREQTRSAWQTPSEAAAYLGLPELGAIPKAYSNNLLSRAFRDPDLQPVPIERASQDHSSTPLQESFRATAASILSVGNDAAGARVLVFTSPRTGDGTTTVVSNLAIAIAGTGNKVLLIDADLRRPRLHDIFDQPNTWGLSDLLREKNAIEEIPPETLVKRTAVQNLHLLPAGTAVENIFALLWSGRLERLLPRFREAFDYVLIDTPPCLEVTDTRIIARCAESAVLVLRPEDNAKSAAQSSVQRLQRGGIPIMGMILNGWDSSWNDI